MVQFLPLPAKYVEFFTKSITQRNTVKIKTGPENKKEPIWSAVIKALFEIQSFMLFIAAACPVQSNPMKVNPNQKRNEIEQLDLCLYTVVPSNCSPQPLETDTGKHK